VSSPYAFDFTVMTPTFNRAHTLPRVYASLQDQTLSNFEWIVIDDGSTDHTPELVGGWCVHSAFPIRYVRQQNLGKHIARNRAVALASGRFFVGLDSDDWLLPGALARLLEVWQTIPQEQRDQFLGVVGRCALPNGNKIGTDLPSNFLDSEEIELRWSLRITGDNAGMSRTEVLRVFPMPSFEGERFVPEAVVQNRIAQQYKTRYFDEVIKICEYQEGGLTGQSRLIRMRSVSASLLYYGELLAISDRIGRRARLRASANFARYALHAGRALGRTRGDTGIGTWLASLPAGVFLWAADRRLAGEGFRMPGHWSRQSTSRATDRETSGA
jgi:glycosyltransferase involved in cell wall biosynthesis